MTRDAVPLKKAVLLCTVMFLASCTGSNLGTPGGKPISGGQAVEMRGIYSARAPIGDDWKTRIDRAKGAMTFNRSSPDGRFTIVGIFPGYLWPGKEKQTEDEIVSMVFSGEENSERERGVVRSYSLKDLSKDVVTIGEKKLHVMKYTVSDRTPVPMEIECAFYLYLPPELKMNRVFYAFRIADVLSIRELVYATDMKLIEYVIDSFQYRNQPYH
jgi:hypothetical protein